MPHSARGIMVLMGSGEMAPSMVETHKYAMSLVDGDIAASFLPTPAGFQLNVDTIALKAVEYFKKSLNTTLSPTSAAPLSSLSPESLKNLVRDIYDANYLFAGPGSPSYAVNNWRETLVLDAFKETLASGGCLTFASAAALTVGRHTLPIYEIYKVGADPQWIEGLDLLGHHGIDLVVIPHWNNTSGGDHDTTYCFMGKPRWEILQPMLDASAVILGIDEHTACILRLEKEVAEIRGKGTVTLIIGGEQHIYQQGDSFDLHLLTSEHQLSEPPAEAVASTTSNEHLSWDAIKASHSHLLESDRPAPSDVSEYLSSVIDFMQHARRHEEWETMQQAEEVLREGIVRVIGQLDAPDSDPSDIASPYIDFLLELRTDLREAKQWGLADRVRDNLQEMGIQIEDGKEGSKWVFAES